MWPWCVFVWNQTYSSTSCVFQVKRFFVLMCMVTTALHNNKVRTIGLDGNSADLSMVNGVFCRPRSTTYFSREWEGHATVCVPGNSHKWSLYTFQHHYYPKAFNVNLLLHLLRQSQDLDKTLAPWSNHLIWDSCQLGGWTRGLNRVS